VARFCRYPRVLKEIYGQKNEESDGQAVQSESAVAGACSHDCEVILRTQLDVRMECKRSKGYI
jgi:hypothetical protein